MRLTFSFQTLILTVLAASLTLATAVWAISVYESIYSIIIHGFDRKLLAIAGGAAVFTDGDAHKDYDREHRITAICGREGVLWGYDDNRRILVHIDTATGGALPLPQTVDLPQTALRELACDPGAGTALGLDAEGRLHALLGDTTDVADAAGQLDEVMVVSGRWWGRRGRELFALSAGAAALPDIAAAAADIDTGNASSTGVAPAPSDKTHVALEEGVDRIAFDALNERFVGVAIAAGEVRLFDGEGRLQARHDINLDGKTIHGLVAHGNSAWLASDALLTVDLAEGTLGEAPPPGYFSEEHPFIARLAPAYRNVREAGGLTFLYTQTSLGDDQIRYILDGSVGDAHTVPGYLDVVPEDSLEDIQLGFAEGKPVVSDIREWETWGLLKFAAEPIYGSDGSIVALAGADVDIGVIRGKTRIALFAVLAVGIVLMMLAAWVSYRVSQGLTRPLRDIKASALRIAAGYFDTTLPTKGHDEVATLAASLNTLSTRLQTQMRQSQTYEQTLISGRMQLALEHALVDELATRRAAIPELRGASSDEYCAVGTDAAVLIWSLEASESGLAKSIANNRCAALATHLLAGLPAAAVRDAVFQALPTVAVLLLWDRPSMTLSVRSRTSLLLRLEAPGEAAKMLTCIDRNSWALEPMQRVHLGGNWVLQPLVAA